MAMETKRMFAVVTGASSGIGYELAKQCVEHGFDVLVCAEDSGIESAATTLDSGPGAVVPVRADLSTFEGVEALVSAIESHHRPVDALLLNAGVGLGGPFTETELEIELKMVALNCNHSLHLTKRMLPAMLARGQGRIL